MAEPIKYVLFPGYVISKHDLDSHWISADRLAYLYGVDIRKCIVVDNRRPSTSMGYRKMPNYVELYPDPSGKYELPKGVK